MELLISIIFLLLFWKGVSIITSSTKKERKYRRQIAQQREQKIAKVISLEDGRVLNNIRTAK